MCTKENTASSETSYNSTQREDAHSCHHYLYLLQQRDESVHYTLQRVYASDRLHILNYHNSANHNTRILIHDTVSPHFHTKRMKSALKKEQQCFSLYCWNKTSLHRERMFLWMCLFSFLSLSHLKPRPVELETNTVMFTFVTKYCEATLEAYKICGRCFISYKTFAKFLFFK